MEKGNGKSIIIIAYQNSVVIRGIEKKLCSLDYKVQILEGDFKRISLCTSTTDLFIFYLPNDMPGDRLKKKQMGDVCEMIYAAGNRMIVIGEMPFRDEMLQTAPKLSKFVWLSRPVDLEELVGIVDKAINATHGKNGEARLLIVDDDPTYAKMVREWLKEIYSVDIVTSGLQAMTFLSKNIVDLVLLDYEMPGMDGPAVLKNLRLNPETSEVPVIFLTGVGERESVAKVMALRPQGYVLKSTTREDLLKYLETQFEKN